MRFLEYAYIINANGKSINDGSIISYSKQGRILSHIAYDPNISGVVSRNVALVLYTDASHRGLPIISNGVVYVLVSTKNGFIKKGEQIATSTIPGVGVKAVKSGYIVGTALEDYNNPNPNSIGKIAVKLNLKYFNSILTFPYSLSDILNLIDLPINENPTYLFAYIAVGVILASIVFMFLNFNRKVTKTLNSNPTAGQAIHLSIVFNVAMFFLIVLTVLTLSFLLFRL